MNPYRSSAEPLVVLRPRRTLLGRLRSWWRRFVLWSKGSGSWRDRWLRRRCGCLAPKRFIVLPNIGRVYAPIPSRCPACDYQEVFEYPDPPDSGAP